MTTNAASIRRTRQTRWLDALSVLAAWFKSPSQVASICPSSQVLLDAIANRECVRTAANIVDLGPGVGGTTAAILEHGHRSCRVLAIEKTPEFIEPLRSLDDPRLTVEHDDAIGLERILLTHQMAKPDVIVSGIPFSSLSPEIAQSIMKSIYRGLADDGTFIAYQLRTHVANHAASQFSAPESTQWVLWNLPPLRIFTWHKRTDIKGKKRSLEDSGPLAID